MTVYLTRSPVFFTLRLMARFIFPMLILLSTAATAQAEKELAGMQLPQVTIYTAKSIITMDTSIPVATAVAVSDGHILGVGTKAEMLALSKNRKTHVNPIFQDKVIMPGFIEPHIHPVLAALTLTAHIISIEDWQMPERNIPAVRSKADYIKRLQQAEQAMPDNDSPLLTWGYHHYFHGKLTRKQLDLLSNTRPILVWHRSAHEFILNTAALKALKIDQKQIADLPPEIQSQTNFSNGHFWERGLLEFLLPKLMPMIATPQRLLAGLAFTQRYLHTSGITTSAEPGGLGDYYPLQIQVLGNRESPFRFYFIPDGRALSLLHQGKELIAATENQLQETQGHAAFLPKQVKLFADGAIFSQLMQMKEGYLDKHEGEWMMAPARFERAFRTYWDAGYQIHIHQNGDAGLDMVLNALEANMKRKPRTNHRTTLVHFGFANPQQVQKIAQLGAIVSANPYYTTALADRYSEIGIGPKRANEMVRLADVVDAGISLSLHSDMPMAPAKPLDLVWSAVNRTTFSGRTAAPQQRIAVEPALRAITLDAAYALQLEHEIGSITAGKKANFTILDNSPYEVNPAVINNIGIWGTVLEGRLQPISPSR